MLCRQLRSTPKAFHNTAQGRGSAPWEKSVAPMIYPEGVAQGAELALCNPFGVDNLSRSFSQGALTRPWAVLCNAFGVRTRF